jgi:thioredoxin 1
MDQARNENVLAHEVGSGGSADSAEESAALRKRARRARRRIILLSVAGAVLLGYAVLAGLGGACGSKLAPIQDLADFQQQVLLAKQPVLVEFFKGGCPTCLALAPVLAQLADEYRGRAVIARFELMKPYFAVTSEELKQRYDISVYPTVILFVGGQEKKRWALNYSIRGYRKALDAAIAGRTEAESEPLPGSQSPPPRPPVSPEAAGIRTRPTL